MSPSEALAGRRDALLLLLVATLLLTWSWDRGAGEVFAAGAATLALALLSRQLVGATTPGRGAVLLAAALPPAALLARGTWLTLGSLLLSVLVALLFVAWPIWIYFWTETPGRQE